MLELAERVGFEPRGASQNTQVIESTTNQKE